MLDPGCTNERAVARVAADRNAAIAHQAALVRRYRGWLQFRRNELAMVGLVTVWCSWSHVAGRTVDRAVEPRRAGPCRQARAAIGCALVRHGRTRPRHLFAHHLRRPHHAGHGGGGCAAGRADGSAVGSMAGYLGGIVDRVMMRVTDIFLAFPRLMLALAFVAALKPGITAACSRSH